MKVVKFLFWSVGLLYMVLMLGLLQYILKLFALSQGYSSWWAFVAMAVFVFILFFGPWTNEKEK